MGSLNKNNKLQIIHFKLLKMNACMEIKYIVKILPLMYLEKIPLSPHYVAGLMNSHGKSVPVIDLALFLAMERKQSYSLDMPILLCENSNEQLAIIVDATQNLSDITPDKLQMQNDFAQSDSPFSAITIENDEQSLLLNMKKIFSSCSSLQNKMILDSENHHG